MAEQTFRVPQVDESGHLTGAALEGVRELIPAGGADGWTAERQAKAQGFWVEHSTEPPAEETKYGVPVVWAAKRALGAQIPVQPFTPSVNLARRIITIPRQIGVSYFINGTETQPGDFNVPGNDARIVAIEAKAASGMYVLPSIFRWERHFGTISNRALWASDTFTGRVGEKLYPVLPAEERPNHKGHEVREGSAWNNKAGGTGTVRWSATGPGAKDINGVDTYNRWVVLESGASAVVDGGEELGMSFNPGTPNISLEVDISEVRKNAALEIYFGNRSGMLNDKSGTVSTIGVRNDGATSSMRDEIPGVPWLRSTNGGPSVGTWRFDFLDGLIVITSPGGIQVVHDRSPLDPAKYGPFCRIRFDQPDSASISAIRVYKSPEA